MNEFEQQVLADLATLKAEMRALLGNGQPGRLRQIEQRVDQHEVMVQRVTGVGALLGALLTAVHVGLDLLRNRM
ncbi:MAG TPA: hypothetical protein VMZ25_05685 [Terriglobales bacterium]|nr:hypothetical protein [Terriglobales bacterium]